MAVEQIKWMALQINSTWVGNNQMIFNTKGQKIVSISVTNLSKSADSLLIGLNEDASSKLYLQAGQSFPLGPYNDDQYCNDNQVKFKWDGSNPDNSGVIVVSYIGDRPFC